MKSTDNAVEVSAQATTTKFDGVLVTIRSRKSFFEVTHAIERALPRFHIPKLMEYVTHATASLMAALKIDFICATSQENSELGVVRAGTDDGFI